MRADAVRHWWPLAAGAAVGLAVGVLVSLIGSSTRKAEAQVLVSSPAGPSAVRPQLANLRELAASGVVAGNVRSTLRLAESTQELRKQLDADVRPQSQVVAITVTDENGERARQLAQEAAVVFAQVVGARFGSATPALQAAVLDSALLVGGPNRHFLRNGVIGALVGLLLGAVAFFVLAGEGWGAPVPAGERELRERERLLEARVNGVAARERALASRAGQLAARERDLAGRERAVAEAPPPPPPEPRPAPEPAAAPRPVGHAGAWNVDALERAVDARVDAPAEQVEEWRAYLFFLRQHAAADGSLPSQFDGLIGDVFGEVVGGPAAS